MRQARGGSLTRRHAGDDVLTATGDAIHEFVAGLIADYARETQSPEADCVAILESADIKVRYTADDEGVSIIIRGVVDVADLASMEEW